MINFIHGAACCVKMHSWMVTPDTQPMAEAGWGLSADGGWWLQAAASVSVRALSPTVLALAPPAALCQSNIVHSRLRGITTAGAEQSNS